MRAGGHPSPAPCCLGDSSPSSTSFPIKTSPYTPCLHAWCSRPGGVWLPVSVVLAPSLSQGVGISGLAGRCGLLPCHGSGDPSPWPPPALAACHRLSRPSRGTRGCSDPRGAVSGGSGPSPSGPVSLLEEREPRALSWPREHREGRRELRTNQQYRHSGGDPRPSTAGEVRVRTGLCYFSVAEQTAWEPQTLPPAPCPLNHAGTARPVSFAPCPRRASQALGPRLGVPSRVMGVRWAGEGGLQGRLLGENRSEMDLPERKA